ncbi:MAG: hypothetical protein ABL893_20300, partial [Hyphomicrobium sp.]
YMVPETSWTVRDRVIPVVRPSTSNRAILVASPDGDTFHLVAPDAVAAPILELPRCFAPEADGRRASIHVPPSIDGIWKLISHCDRKRVPVTRARLHEAVVGDDALSTNDVDQYLLSLVRGGFIASVDGDTFRLLKRQRETPRLTQGGKPLAHAARANHLWRAMKMCGYFTARELAFAASMPDWPVNEAQAEAFASELASAGYLLRRAPGPGTGSSAVYRLKPKMNTGPDAPRLLRARFVWDPNLCRIVGAATKVEEARI